MNKYFNQFLGILFLLFLCSACSKSTFEESNLEMGYEYFPLEIGKYRIYQLDSTLYDTTGTGIEITNLSSQIREEIIDTLIDNEGRLNYQIERSWRRDNSQAWQLLDIWLTNRGENSAERIEENFRFIKMVFPVSEGRAWNGNAFVDESTNVSVAGETIEIFKNWSSEIIEVGITKVIDANTFPDVVEISHADSENFIELRSSKEFYAKDIGLISREMRILDTQKITESEPWESKAQKGFILVQNLIEYN